MSQIPGIRGQFALDELYDASGTITAGGTSQLLLPRAQVRSYLYIQNLSNNTLWVDFGGARATATISSGVVNAVTMTNKGRGYTLPPKVLFYGGGPIDRKTTPALGIALPGSPAPSNIAEAIAVMAGSAPNQTVDSITIQQGGSGYLKAPFVFIENDPRDPYGSVDPFYGSAESGFRLEAGGSFNSILEMNTGQCPTSAVAIYGPDNDQAFTCKFMM